ncbi:MAG: hypothetical protein Q9O62_04480 [Ardenticatenia bacterium]|nr:hypothetical protein [Ardenticatenia bacterium]
MGGRYIAPFPIRQTGLRQSALQCTGIEADNHLLADFYNYGVYLTGERLHALQACSVTINISVLEQHSSVFEKTPNVLEVR